MNVYVDTGGWVAYFDQSDRFHPLVTSYMQAMLLQAVDHLLTSDYVFRSTKRGLICGIMSHMRQLSRPCGR